MFLTLCSHAGLPASTHYTHTVCEGEAWFLTCPRGTDIRVEAAFFGRNDSTTCYNSDDVSHV